MNVKFFSINTNKVLLFYNPNFVSILVGNGVTDPTSDSVMNSLLPFMYGHAIFSAKMNNEIGKYCSSDPNGNKCQGLLNDAFNLMNDIDVSKICSKTLL